MHQTENPSKIKKEGQPLKLVLSLKMERTARDIPSGSIINGFLPVSDQGPDYTQQA
jgi:hypothetical protein